MKFKLLKIKNDLLNSGAGLLHGFKFKLFWIVFVISMFLFLYLVLFMQNFSLNISLLTSGISAAKKFDLLLDVFAIFPTMVSQFFGFAVLFLVLIQSVNIGMLFVSRKIVNLTDVTSATNSGVAGVIMMLGLGCPSCGTSLIAPLVATIFGASSFVMLGIISNIIIVIAYILCLYALIRVGLIIYLAKISLAYDESIK